MVAQRGEGVKARKAEEKAAKAARRKSEKPKARKSSGKLSFKDKHALDTLPGEIEQSKRVSPRSKPNWRTQSVHEEPRALQRRLERACPAD
jgi:hypothetical protein